MQSNALTPAQWRTLQALVDQLIPADEAPGGWLGGVGVYLAQQFERDLQDKLGLYQAGLNALDAEAVAEHQCAFAMLAPAAQIALLNALEAGHLQTHWSQTPAAFIAMAMGHAAEGYYSDPGNGATGAGWSLVGFEVRG